jgi:hypothetical protein
MRWIILFTIATAGSFSASAQPSANLEELHRLIAEQQYAPALQKITAALALKGPAAKSVDRYQLFMLKGECLLQNKATRLALDAYTAAIKEAESDRDRSLAEAHETLVKESKGFAYTPKTSTVAAPTPPNTPKPRPAPIDILNLESRKKAFAALLADELAANDAKVKVAKTSKALPPIAQLFAPLSKMEGIELASLPEGGEGGAGGEAVKVKAVRAELIDAAKKIVAEALRGMSKRLSEIDKSANTFVEFYQESIDAFARPVMTKMYKKKGLTDPQTKELTETSATCDKLSPALTELAKGLGAQDKTFDPFSEEAARIRKEVDRVLDTDYLRVYRELPK